MLYLGGILVADGRADSEISRKIGAAMVDFRQLSKVWGHANVFRSRKVVLFHSLVVSKLLYGLSSIWLVTAQRRRLEGIYARCLRRILSIPNAYISRVSNAQVFGRAGVQPLSAQLKRKQLELLNKVAHSPTDSPVRMNTFIAGTLQPQIGSCKRRVGRPRQDWTSQLIVTPAFNK